MTSTYSCRAKTFSRIGLTNNMHNCRIRVGFDATESSRKQAEKTYPEEAEAISQRLSAPASPSQACRRAQDDPGAFPFEHGKSQIIEISILFS